MFFITFITPELHSILCEAYHLKHSEKVPFVLTYLSIGQCKWAEDRIRTSLHRPKLSSLPVTGRTVPPLDLILVSPGKEEPTSMSLSLAPLNSSRARRVYTRPVIPGVTFSLINLIRAVSYSYSIFSGGFLNLKQWRTLKRFYFATPTECVKTPPLNISVSGLFIHSVNIFQILPQGLL